MFSASFRLSGSSYRELTAEVLSNRPEMVILTLAFLAWILSEIIGAGILPRLRQRGGVKRKSDRRSRVAIYIGLYASIAIGISFA